MTEHRPPRISLRRIRLNQGGYDDMGCYWGTGRPLYWYGSDDGWHDDHIRADDREHAKLLVREACRPVDVGFYR